MQGIFFTLGIITEIGFMEWVYLAVFYTAFLIQISFYISFQKGISRILKVQPQPIDEPVSVVICAHNHREQLERNLPHVLYQEYPNFEVVVVNDRSFDGTKDHLDGLEHDRLKVVHIDPDAQGRMGKKFALSLGIKAAKHDNLLLTDADCRPKGPNWISTMMAAKGERKIVLGYGAYERNPTPFNLLERYDAFYKAILMFGRAGLGKPYMGVGRNLLYEKELFFGQGGFKQHMNLLSGDDDLFVNAVANDRNTTACLDQAGKTLSAPSKGMGEWFRRKRRHYTTGPRYKWRDKAVLSLFSASALLCWLGLAGIFFFKNLLWIVLAAFLLRGLLQLYIFNRTMKELGERGLLLFAPLLEMPLLLLDSIILLSNTIAPPRKWK